VTNFFIFVTKKEKSTQPPPMLGIFVTAPIDGTSQRYGKIGALYQIAIWFGIMLLIW
jgi:hypothetical protein